MTAVKISKNSILKETSEGLDSIVSNIIKAVTRTFMNNGKTDKKMSLNILNNYFNKESPTLHIDTVFPHYNDMNALAIAAFAKNSDELKALIKMGAKVDMRYQKSQQSLLHIAVAVDSIAILKILIDDFIAKGLSVDLIDKDGTTPLMLACQRNKKEMIDILLCAQADPSMKDFNHKSSIDYLLSLDNYDLSIKNSIEQFMIVQKLDIKENRKSIMKI